MCLDFNFEFDGEYKHVRRSAKEYIDFVEDPHRPLFNEIPQYGCMVAAMLIRHIGLNIGP
jgi:hypothetical protein